MIDSSGVDLQVVIPGEAPKYSGLMQGIGVIAKEEGVLALWKGLTPRLLRISELMLVPVRCSRKHAVPLRECVSQFLN